MSTEYAILPNVALLYRAIWNDDRPDLRQGAGEAFFSWVLEKDPRTNGRADHSWTPIDDSQAFRQVAIGGLTETDQATGTEWITTLRVSQGDETSSGWLNIDVERTTDEAFERTEVAAPRLVRALIDAGHDQAGNPRIGPVNLSTNALGINSPTQVTEELVPLVEDPERRVPLVFFSHDGSEDPGITANRAHMAAEQLAGIARVYLLTNVAQYVFNDELGEDLAVWGGGARMYLPGDLDPWRHRYVPWYHVKRHPREAGRRFSWMLRNVSPATRLPEQLRHLDSEIRQSEVHSLKAVVKRRDDEIESLRQELKRMEEEHLDAVALAEEAQVESDARLQQVVSLSASLNKDDAESAEVTLPEKVSTFEEVVELARDHLRMLSIPEDAPQDIDRLDNAMEGPVWARKAWHGLRALNQYAMSREEGGFVSWCQRGHPLAWPTSKGKLAIHESPTVKNNDDLWERRLFLVEGDNAATRRIHMEAHLKISEGGGQNIPRIYFHDDIWGRTRKVHIGFIGPHYLVPNTKRD
jgi:hypothetical protein